ncbi:MAG TPA: F0F1 ATP synthase subunit delta [Pedococcus sp.]|nr:F0F1 ATP synthase subunit delta [Pedococcus sp.]
MRGSSRAAAAAGQRAFQSALASGADWGTLAEDLFGITALIDGNATLRRAVADPSRDARAKRDLVARLFGGKVNQAAVDVLSELVAQRWSTERDLSDTVESLAIETVLAAAEASGRGDQVEDELFRFERIVAGNPALRDALVNRNVDPERKAELVGRLLQGKVTAETARLARQSVLAPRGRKFDRTLELYLALAAKRREQLTAVVIAAVPLDETQRHRLAAALQGIYGKPVQLQLVIDEKVVGGIRVQIGDEVVDGTILRKLEGARRHFAG